MNAIIPNGIPAEHGLIVAAILFVLGMTGVLIRHDLIFILLSLEVMLNAAGLAFVTAASRWLHPDGQIMFTLILMGSHLTGRGVSIIGVGAAGLSAAVAVPAGIRFILAPPPAGAYVQPLWEWMSASGFTPVLALYLYPLAVVMILVITTVSFLILLYSSEHMAGGGRASDAFSLT